MREEFSRTQLLYGKEAMDRLAASRVAVFGIGGVGGYVVEALARSGIGALDLIDNDRVCLSNINRQIIATHQTLGCYKVDAAAERIRDIAPACRVQTYKTFFLPDTQDEFDFTVYDYVVDAIDTVTGKLAIVEKAKAAGVPVISSMGAGNKTDPAAFAVADIYETSVCPLAKVMRREVVYSKEKPLQPMPVALDGQPAGGAAESADGGQPAGRVVGKAYLPEEACPSEEVRPSEASSRDAVRRSIPGSTAFVPSVAGLIIAGEIVNELTRSSFS